MMGDIYEKVSITRGIEGLGMQLALVSIGPSRGFNIFKDRFFSERSKYISVLVFGGEAAQFQPSTDPADQELIKVSQSHLLGDFFDCLNDLMTRDLTVCLVVGVLAGSLGLFEKIEGQEEFIVRPVKNALLNLYLGLCPMESQELIDLTTNVVNSKAMPGVNMTENILFRPENGMMAMKKKPADILPNLPDFVLDYSLLWTNPGLKAKLEEGWDSNVPEVFRDKLRPIVARSGLTKHICKEQIESPFLKLIPSLPEKLAQIPYPNHFLYSLFRMMISMLSYFTPHELRIEADQLTELLQVSLEKFIDEADKAFKGSPEVARFSDKIHLLQAQYFKMITRSRTASEAEIAAESASKERAKKVKEMFEKKKIRALSKVKTRQSAFNIGLTSKAKTMAQKITQPSNEELICAVSREPLNGDHTYYQFGFYNHCNV